MNQFEMSAVLYYADFLSLQYQSKPCTQQCKYFFVHGVPINIAYIVEQDPVYDIDNQWFQKSLKEYSMLKHKFGEDGAMSFIKNLCNLGVAGSVNATQMMKYIHRYDDKQERDKAFRAFKFNRSKMKYTHLTRNDDGEIIEEECTKYKPMLSKIAKDKDFLRAAEIIERAEKNGRRLGFYEPDNDESI